MSISSAFAGDARAKPPAMPAISANAAVVRIIRLQGPMAFSLVGYGFGSQFPIVADSTIDQAALPVISSRIMAKSWRSIST